MSGVAKRIAIVLLGLMALPFVMLFAQRPTMTIPVWAGAACLLFRVAFPPSRRPVADAMAVMAGQLAFFIHLGLYASGLHYTVIAIILWSQAALTLAALTTLWLRPERQVAVGLIVLQAAALAFHVAGVLHLAPKAFDGAASDFVLPASDLVAMALLGLFLHRQARPLPADPQAVGETFR